MTPEPLLLAWSGGKDSALALQSLRESGRWEVVGLLTTVTEGYDRISMHGVRVQLLREQAAAVGLPLQVVGIPPQADNATYERRMGEALTAARNAGIRRVAFGDLFLEDVRRYREEMLERLGLAGVFPIWGRSTAEVAEHFVACAFRAVLTCVDTTQIAADFAGRAYDRALLRDLPASADPCGERGEFHTFVYDGPLFTQRVALRLGERVLRDSRFMYRDLLPG